MTTLLLAEVKNRLSEVVNELVATHDRVVVTRNGRPAAVILSPDDLEALEETLAVLADQDLVHQLLDSRADIAAGRLHGADTARCRPANRDRRALRTRFSTRTVLREPGGEIPPGYSLEGTSPVTTRSTRQFLRWIQAQNSKCHEGVTWNTRAVALP